MVNVQDHKIRILVVDDSSVARGIWARILGEEPDFVVVERASDGLQALEALRRAPVDVVLLDLQMPGMDGTTAIPLIRKEFPRVKIIAASALTTQGSKAAFEALRLGAADYITKPTTSGGSGNMSEVARDLMGKIRAHARMPGHKPFEPMPAAPIAPVPSVVPSPTVLMGAPTLTPQVLGIGTSTGGPAALQVVLGALSPAFRLPIFVVQHMPPYFTTVLAETISKATGRDCKEAKHGEVVQSGRIYIAPGDFHMAVVSRSDKVFIDLNQNPPESFCRPSVNPLFRSLAAVYGNKTLAVVLTGIGDDGKIGSEEIVKQGGRVLVQDEASSVVWGMPGSIARAGIASAILPLDHVAGEIERLSSTGQRRLER